MFGGHDDNTDDAAPAAQDGAMNGVNDLAATAGGMMPSATPAAPAAPTYDAGTGFTGSNMAQPDDAAAPAPAEPEAPEETSAAPSVVQPASDAGASDSDDLLDLKQQALQQLSPLVGHLDQTPEEKFRTTMMMIQATDNQALLKEAYAAAQAIPDDKVRAQALLDVVNEINYFTQNKQQAQE